MRKLKIMMDGTEGNWHAYLYGVKVAVVECPWVFCSSSKSAQGGGDQHRWLKTRGGCQPCRVPERAMHSRILIIARGLRVYKLDSDVEQ